MAPLRNFEHHAGFRFEFDAEERLLGDAARHWRRLGLDRAGRGFIDRCLEQPAGAWRTRLQRVLRHVVSDFDANAWLGMYPMHLASSEQFAELLAGDAFERALDVGAGNGDVTEQLRELCRECWVTERSRGMRARLRRRGFHVAEEDLAAHPRDYDLVSCLNVLDRTAHPRSLLLELEGRLRPGGKLLLAVPLPIDPFYYGAARTRRPREALPAPQHGFERNLLALVDWCRTAAPKLELHALSRAPYLSGGDDERSLYVLDAGLIAFRRPLDSAPRQPDQSVDDSGRPSARSPNGKA